MNKVLNINSEKVEMMERLRYESYLNSIESAFLEHKSGIRLTDKILLDFADSVIKKFAAIYANARDEELGKDTEEVIIDTKFFNN